MATIETRPPRRAGGNTTYRVRYRDPAGIQRSKTFAKKGLATRFAADVEADKHRGTYVDHTLGKMTLAEYAESWLAMQTFAETTREATAGRLRNHVIPTLGSTPLSSLRPSQLQPWVRSKQHDLSPRTVRVLVATLSAVLKSAVIDDRIAKNPCEGLNLPKLGERRIVPWKHSQVLGIRVALPERYGLLAVLATGLGLRQGEVFGLSVDDIDWAGRVVHVQRQVVHVGAQLRFSLPKGEKERTVPMSDAVAQSLSTYLQDFPAVSVTLPSVGYLARKPTTTARLLVTSREAGALNRNYINKFVWKKAIVTAGLADTRENGMHAGRHYYASVQLEGGTSVRALADYLGHADPGFTLRTYTHLMPQAEDKSRRAVDEAFAEVERLWREGDDGAAGAAAAV